MASIELRDVHLQFRLNKQRLPLKDRFVQRLMRKSTVQSLEALKEVNLNFCEGERIGVILCGANTGTVPA